MIKLVDDKVFCVSLVVLEDSTCNQRSPTLPFFFFLETRPASSSPSSISFRASSLFTLGSFYGHKNINTFTHAGNTVCRTQGEAVTQTGANNPPTDAFG